MKLLKEIKIFILKLNIFRIEIFKIKFNFKIPIMKAASQRGSNPRKGSCCRTTERGIVYKEKNRCRMADRIDKTRRRNEKGTGESQDL